MKSVAALGGGAVLALLDIIHADGTRLDLARHFLRLIKQVLINFLPLT